MPFGRVPVPAAVVDVEVTGPLDDLTDLGDARAVFALARVHGVPVGAVSAPVIDGRCSAHVLNQRVSTNMAWEIGRALLYHLLLNPVPEHGYRIADAIAAPAPPAFALPTVTVAVCSRDRTADLAIALESVVRLEHVHEIVVVDNAPTTSATRELVDSYRSVRYVCEPRPGLDWARNRAIAEATGDIVAFTDDDVVVDAQWTRAIADAFAGDHNVMAVTGLVTPFELETEAQELFERYGGFGRGYRRRWVQADLSGATPVVGHLVGTGLLGTGANLAFRRSVFSDVGLFDPALDVGTLTGGAGDLDMLFRVLKGGWKLVYEPAALVRHRHRRSIEKLHAQLVAHGSLYSYLEAVRRRHPDEARYAWELALRWEPQHHLKRFARSIAIPGWLPPRLVLDEVWGELRAVLGRRYARARRAAEALERAHGQQKVELPPAPPRPTGGGDAVAVRTVDLRSGVTSLTGLDGYRSVRCYICDGPVPIGVVDFPQPCGVISAAQLRDGIVDHLGFHLLESQERDVWARSAIDRAAWHFLDELPRPSASSVSEKHAGTTLRCSVIVATKDRPLDLRRCLASVVEQAHAFGAEVIVCDNNPASGVTAPVVAAFPGVTLVNEPRQGVAYARNRAILEATGDVVAIIDDDAEANEDWLANLVAPLQRRDVMAVTGNILPAELDTEAQQQFEDYQTLGRGYLRWEADRGWFNWGRWAVPTWELGGTCNAAVRRAAFNDDAIGLMDEALGPGMPTGVGEDSYLLYRILKAGYTIVYEPTAVVWHHHRRDGSALQRQLFGYYKGAVAHQLATLQRDRDLRAARHLAVELPRWYGQQLRAIARGSSNKPLQVWLTQLRGFVAGPSAYVRSRARVRRWGTSREPRA
jgi:GT2 family glycosyltransferase